MSELLVVVSDWMFEGTIYMSWRAYILVPKYINGLKVIN